MVKKVVAIRLEESIIEDLKKHGKVTDIVRKIIEENLKPNVVYVEVPSVNIFGEAWNKEISRLVLKDEITDGLPSWYIEKRKKEFENRYGEKV